MTDEERRRWERYTTVLLPALGEWRGKPPSAAVMRSHQCASCTQPVPAGMPVEWRDHAEDLCPACVVAKDADRAAERELNDASPEPAEATRYLAERLRARPATAIVKMAAAPREVRR